MFGKLAKQLLKNYFTNFNYTISWASFKKMIFAIS